MALTKAGRDLTEAHKQAQLELSKRSADEALLLGRELNPLQLDATKLNWMGLQLTSSEQYFNASATIANAYLQEYRAIEGAPGIVAQPIFDAAQALRETDHLIGYAKRLTGTLTPQRALEQALDWYLWRAQMMTLNGGRGLLMGSSSINVNSLGWRRVTDGHPCSFCAMLASLGPVYNSAGSARYVSGYKLGGKDYKAVDKLGLTGSARRAKLTEISSRSTRRGRQTKQNLGDKYHAFCGCTVEEVFDEWIPTAQEERWGEIFTQADTGDLNETLANMRRHDAGKSFNDGVAPPKTQSGGSGGGKKPPSNQGSSCAGEAPKPPRDPADGGDKQQWLQYWSDRQSQIPLDFRGDRLKPDEVPSVERLIRRGEEIEWIPAAHSRSSNDFIWVNRGGHEFEMKSTKAKYETIRGRIFSATKAAWKNHQVTKDRFLIDIGNEPLTQDLMNQLAMYNIDRSKYPIKDLWVMSSDGKQLTRITLENPET